MDGISTSKRPKYQTLISLAEESVEWRANAVLMAEQWQHLYADGTIASFWRNLPKKSLNKRVMQAQVRYDALKQPITPTLKYPAHNSVFHSLSIPPDRPNIFIKSYQ
jgi:hypothetical protein